MTAMSARRCRSAASPQLPGQCQDSMAFCLQGYLKSLPQHQTSSTSKIRAARGSSVHSMTARSPSVRIPSASCQHPVSPCQGLQCSVTVGHPALVHIR